MDQTRVTWLGHASVLLESGRTRILFDPTVRPRLLHLRRPTVVDRRHLEQVDAVFVSHAHHDHLDLGSIRRIRALSPDAELLAPTGASEVLRLGGFRDAVQVAVGDERLVDDARVRTAFAAHDGTRTGRFVARSTASAVSYVVQAANGTRIWFAGDTELDDRLAEVGPVDVALVPVGGWWRSLGPGHMDPAEAARAVAMVGARVAVPIHWGTYHPVLLRRAMVTAWATAPTAFVDACEELDVEIDVRVLQPGESTTIAADRERHHGAA